MIKEYKDLDIEEKKEYIALKSQLIHKYYLAMIFIQLVIVAISISKLFHKNNFLFVIVATSFNFVYFYYFSYKEEKEFKQLYGL